jgi:hypothetical protein
MKAIPATGRRLAVRGGRGAACAALVALGGCVAFDGPAGGPAAALGDAAAQVTQASDPFAVEPGPTALIDERLTPVPEEFEATGRARWDGRRTLQGIWVAHPAARTARRVRIVNSANGHAVDGALFRRDDTARGSEVLVSSDAAAALGMEPGEPADLVIVAIKRAEATATAAAPAGDGGASAADGEADAPEEAGDGAGTARAGTAEDPADAVETAAADAVETAAVEESAAPAEAGEPPAETAEAAGAEEPAEAQDGPAPAGETVEAEADGAGEPVGLAALAIGEESAEAEEADREPAPAEEAEPTPPPQPAAAPEPEAAAEAEAAAPEENGAAGPADAGEPVVEDWPIARDTGDTGDTGAEDAAEAEGAEPADAASDAPAGTAGAAAETGTDAGADARIARAPEPEETPAPDDAAGEPAPALDRPYIQAGIFGVESNASRLIRVIEEAGFPAEGKPFRGGRLTRVVAGPFASRAERDAALATIREIGPSDALPVER